MPVTARPLVPTTTLAFPDAHADAAAYGLAVRLGAEYGRPIRQDVVAIADDRVTRLLAAYLTQVPVEIDPAYGMGRRWFTGSNDTVEQNVFKIGQGVLK